MKINKFNRRFARSQWRNSFASGMFKRRERPRHVKGAFAKPVGFAEFVAAANL